MELAGIAEAGKGGGEAAAGKTGDKKDDSSKRGAAPDAPSAKRSAGSQRALPDGVVVVDIAKDGNCFSA